MASKDPNFYRSRNANFYRLDPPEYVAFRKADGDSTLAVIARLEARDVVGHQLGHWFSALTPDGDFRDVPVHPERYGIHESVAQELIQLIRDGQPLPERLIRMLPEI
jgi:hypothetical protein